MAIVFPSSPTTNDTFSAGSITYKYDGAKWIGLGVTPTDRLVEGSNKLEIDANNDLVWTGNNLKLVDSAETTASLFIGGTKKSTWQAQDNFGTILYSYDNEPLIFSTSSSNGYAERASIDSSGTFKVGSSATINVKLSPNTGLEINDGAINSYQATSNVNATPFKIRSDVGGTGVEKLSIKADGDIVIGGNDINSGLNGIKMYVSGTDPSIIAAKADNNPGSAVTLLKLAGYSQSGTNYRENAAILFETDSANNSGNASGRILLRTENHNETNGPRTRVTIDDSGKFIHAGGRTNNSGGDNLGEGQYNRITASRNINPNDSKTFTISGLQSGWMRISAGGYSSAGQSQFAIFYTMGGFMTATSTYNVVKLQEWGNGVTITTTKNASSYDIVLQNNSGTYALSCNFTVESSSGNLKITSN